MEVHAHVKFQVDTSRTVVSRKLSLTFTNNQLNQRRRSGYDNSSFYPRKVELMMILQLVCCAAASKIINKTANYQ